jgi:hypothetical protein
MRSSVKITGLNKIKMRDWGAVANIGVEYVNSYAIADEFCRGLKETLSENADAFFSDGVMRVWLGLGDDDYPMLRIKLEEVLLEEIEMLCGDRRDVPHPDDIEAARKQLTALHRTLAKCDKLVQLAQEKIEKSGYCVWPREEDEK